MWGGSQHLPLFNIVSRLATQSEGKDRGHVLKKNYDNLYKRVIPRLSEGPRCSRPVVQPHPSFCRGRANLGQNPFSMTCLSGTMAASLCDAKLDTPHGLHKPNTHPRAMHRNAEGARAVWPATSCKPNVLMRRATFLRKSMFRGHECPCHHHLFSFVSNCFLHNSHRKISNPKAKQVPNNPTPTNRWSRRQCGGSSRQKSSGGSEETAFFTQS